MVILTANKIHADFMQGGLTTFPEKGLDYNNQSVINKKTLWKG